MTEPGYPSVFTVDMRANQPPVPPRLREKRRSPGVAQTLLFLLVSLALCGIVIEAYFIFRLYKPESESSASHSKQIAEKDDSTPSKRPGGDVLPSKPVAHLTVGNDANNKGQIMSWSEVADPILFEMDYRDRSLIIQKEGFYYVYTKVCFFKRQAFNVSIHVRTSRYKGKSIPLLMSRTNSDTEQETSISRSNSFLGGVFHLYRGDAVFVKVSDKSQVARYKFYENIFGAYMI